jgi:hypothetical protein
VELPRGDTGWGGGTCPRSSEVEPNPAVDGCDVRGRGGGPSRSRDVEVVGGWPVGGGAVDGAGPDRSSDVLAAAPETEPGPGPADGGRGYRPGGAVGAGPDRSKEVLPPSDPDREEVCDAGRPAGAGPDRSSDVLAASVVPRAAGAACGADRSNDGELPAAVRLVSAARAE